MANPGSPIQAIGRASDLLFGMTVHQHSITSALILILLLSTTAFARNRHFYPTIPGTQFRNYSKPGVVIQEDGKVYQTVPGTNFRDYSAPAYIQQGNHIQPTVPGTYFPDYAQPGYIVQ